MPDSPRSETPASSASVRWFYSQDGAVIGPMPLASLQTLWKAGELPSGTLAVQEGQEDWQALSDMLGAVSVPPTAPPLPPTYSPATPPLRQHSVEPVVRDKKGASNGKQSVLRMVLVSLVFLFVGLLVIGIVGDLNSGNNPSQTEHKRAPAPGLTTETNRLRTIKAGARLFRDNGAKAEYERYDKAKKLVPIDRMAFEGRYRSPLAPEAAEMVGGSSAGSLAQIKIYRNSKSTLWLTDAANLLPFDEAVIKRGASDFNTKNKDFLAQSGERARWKGQTARIKAKSYLFADDDVLWEWLGENGEDKLMTEARSSELVAGNRMLFTDGDDNTGTVLSVDGPYFRWFKMETNVNGKLVELWAPDDAATFEEPKPDPAIMLERIRHTVERVLRERFKDRIRKIEASEKEGAYSVRVDFTGRDGLTTSLIREAIEYDMAEGYHAIFKGSGEIVSASMRAYLPLTDKFGATKDGVVYQTELDAESAKQVHWEMSHALPWSEIWQTKRLHPMFKQ